MKPRLFSVYFGGEQYTQMAAVLRHSARLWCPGWDIDVRQVAKPTRQTATGSQSHADNSWKLELWCAEVQAAPEGSLLLILDADTFITWRLEPLWSVGFDVAYTARAPGSRYPINAGVIAVRVNDRSRRFMSMWARTDIELAGNLSLHQEWRRRFGGMNQASLGKVLAAGTPGVTVLDLLCKTWNCEDLSWRFFGEHTRIVHVKSALRLSVFDVVRIPSLSRLTSLWKAWALEAGVNLSYSGGSMGFTEADLEAIRRAIATGERQVQFSDRGVTYRSIDELLQAEKHIAAALAGRNKQMLGVADKGFGE